MIQIQAALLQEYVDNLEWLLPDGAAPSPWYRDWGSLVQHYGAAFGLTAEQSCCSFAALSPNKSIGRNWIMFVKALEVGPLEVKEATMVQRLKVHRILTGGESPWGILKGPKEMPFARALYGYGDAVTVDRVMVYAATGRTDRSAPNETMRVHIVLAIQHVASRLGWTPAETQATLWVAWRAFNTGRRRTADPDPATLY